MDKFRAVVNAVMNFVYGEYLMSLLTFAFSPLYRAYGKQHRTYVCHAHLTRKGLWIHSFVVNCLAVVEMRSAQNAHNMVLYKSVGSTVLSDYIQQLTLELLLIFALWLQAPSYLSRVGHKWKIRARRQRTDVGKCCFVNRTVADWNRLPGEAIRDLTVYRVL